MQDQAPGLWAVSAAYGEWLWEWATEAGLDPDAIHDAAVAAKAGEVER